MLRVSSKGRYGVKAVYELARNYGNGALTVSAIARRQAISEQYLEQLMVPLKRAGLVVGVRGAQGGYRLARQPAEISVGDVVRALEGPIGIADCTSEAASSCPEIGRCIGPDVWSRVQDALLGAMDAMTFQQLVEEQQEAVRDKLLARVVQAGGG
ncbi:Rrf2 family transcriptional regulator [Candidatus Hydrogenisulfobacillus filiaventi]|uniref:Rrf2 family transcriptional regulator n=1 Tax=Candidatus Hydrogenisulfobacillus filiaventi TaxID=2707344 RepID=A0A6F8ZGX4_9FIRM|nr:Rrf2 family transcriptional regulator [Bacillota bacterium]CAB1128961.1 Rrf2 family transcriptional regulator [Candidatus Hydrogenisulfobacillus filiaventi]